jgi:hypothetical protein
LPQASKSKKCAKCNIEYSSKYKFCTECGLELVNKLTCPSCKKNLTKITKFCSDCGSALGDTESDLILDGWVEDESPEKEPSQFQSTPIGRSVPGIVGLVVGVFVIIIMIMFFNGNSLKSLNPTIRMPNGFEIKYSTCLANDSEQRCKDYFNNNKSDWIIGRLG